MRKNVIFLREHRELGDVAWQRDHDRSQPLAGETAYVRGPVCCAAPTAPPSSDGLSGLEILRGWTLRGSASWRIVQPQ